MPRIRTIKPKFWDDIKLSKVSRDARLLFIGMWTFADDLGVIIADGVWLKSKIFPYDLLAPDEIQNWIEELLTYKFILPLEYKDEIFFIIRTFDKHQRIDKPNKDDIFIDNEEIRIILEQSRNNLGTIVDSAKINRISIPHGEESKGEESNSKGKEDGDFLKKNDDRVNMPFNGEFSNIWLEWKKYKWTQHHFKYKSDGSEQSALHSLTSLSPDESICIAIIQQSMANGWKGFFPLKNNLQNGKSNSNNSNNNGFSREGIQTKLADRIKERQQARN